MDKEKADEMKARSRAAFDVQAGTYDTGMQGNHARALYRIVADEVARACQNIPSPRVLDLGCGTGALAGIVLDEIPNCTLVGVDLSANMVELATERFGRRAEAVVGDAEHLPFHDNSFDVAYCNDSFHHYPDPVLATFQVWRALRPGGTFVVGDVWQPSPARAVMNAWMPLSSEGDVRIYSEGEMREILGKWFGSVSWRRIGLTSCVAIARKDWPLMPKMEEKETPCSWSKRSQSCESTENYLKAILEIRSSHSRCRNVDISRHLNFSRASVSEALVKLSKAGLVKIAEHDVRLTAEGRRIAEELTERYQFFEKLLREAGVDVDEASREACRLEHCVSADSFEKLSSHFRRNRSLGKTVENDETPATPPRRYSGGVVAKPTRFREFARMTLPGSPPGATVILEFRFSG